MSKLTDFVKQNGKLPPVTLIIQPIGNEGRDVVRLSNFLSYEFNSSILIPVDTFSFTFKNPNNTERFYDFIRDGDIVILEANGTTIAQGIIDVVDINTTEGDAEIVSVHGRDLMGQLEDQTSISTSAKPIFASPMSIEQAVNALIKDTRIKGFRPQDTPRNQYTLATEPGESKLSSLQRFLEPLNCVAWMTADGYIKVGRPNMAQSTPTFGELVMDSTARRANCLQMKAIRSSTQIPNIVAALWSGQELVQNRISPDQVILNNAAGPKRLRVANHRVPKAVVSSTPQGASAQDLSNNNDYLVAADAGSTIIQALAKREIARANVNELIVQATRMGHYNDDLVPFMPDQMYDVVYPRASLTGDKMYCYQVSYSLAPDQSQRTTLSLTKLGTIVSDVRAR